MGKLKDTEITVTVPGGQFCESKTYSCRFLVPMSNHPGCYCFLIPDSYWDNYAEKRKHRECPTLTQVPKPVKGEGLPVMERLRQFRDLMKGDAK